VAEHGQPHTVDARTRIPSLPVTIEDGRKTRLATHALYLSWQYYLIHAPHDTRKIGRASSERLVSGFITTHRELFQVLCARVGTQVRLI